MNKLLFCMLMTANFVFSAAVPDEMPVEGDGFDVMFVEDHNQRAANLSEEDQPKICVDVFSLAGRQIIYETTNATIDQLIEVAKNHTMTQLCHPDEMFIYALAAHEYQTLCYKEKRRPYLEEFIEFFFVSFCYLRDIALEMSLDEQVTTAVSRGNVTIVLTQEDKEKILRIGNLQEAFRNCTVCEDLLNRYEKKLVYGLTATISAVTYGLTHLALSYLETQNEGS